MHALSKTQAKAGSKASHLFPISMIGDTHAHWEHTVTVGLTIYRGNQRSRPQLTEYRVIKKQPDFKL